jgi:hypothetical protein
MNNMKNKMDLIATLFAVSNTYGEYRDYLNCSEEANDCLLKMYFYLLEEDNNKKEKRWNEFEKSYDNLNELDQEIIKNDLIDILENQNKGNIKKKRRDLI